MLQSNRAGRSKEIAAIRIEDRGQIVAQHPIQSGEDLVALGLDCAASEFFKDGRYHIEAEGLVLDSGEWTDVLSSWVDKYPIISIEDGMSEGDWDGWKTLTTRLRDRVQLVGDDLFVTNPKRLAEGV